MGKILKVTRSHFDWLSMNELEAYIPLVVSLSKDERIVRVFI